MSGAYLQLPWTSLDSMSALCHCKQRNHKQNVQKRSKTKTAKETLAGVVQELKQKVQHKLVQSIWILAFFQCSSNIHTFSIASLNRNLWIVNNVIFVSKDIETRCSQKINGLFFLGILFSIS